MRFALIFALILFVVSCGVNAPTTDTLPPSGASASVVNEIKPADALPKVQEAYAQFVDVRTPEEYAAGHATRSVNIPLNELPKNLDRLEKNEPVYVICQTGRRSKEAADILAKNGFKWVFSVTGGTEQWQADGLPIDSPSQSK
jgi:rhodanese-related sulfurtransferase